MSDRDSLEVVADTQREGALPAPQAHADSGGSMKQWALDDDELRQLVLHHTSRHAKLLGRAERYREFLPDKSAAEQEAECRAEAWRHHARAEELAAALREEK